MNADPNRFKLQAAKELMQADQYDAARAVLETISNHPTAQQWLTWMDENVGRKRKQGARWGWLRIIPLILVCSLCSFIGGFGAARTPVTTNTQPTQTQIVAVATIVSTATVPPATSQPTDEPTVSIPDVEPILFDSATEGLQAVIGPVDIPTGLYQVTVTTDGFISVSTEAAAGECEGFGLGDSLFLLTEGNATDGAETLFGSNGCRAIIEVSGANEAWTLEFGALEPLPVGTALSFNSDDEGLHAVIGPVLIPSGIYRATLTTDGVLSANIETVSGTCDAGLGGLLFLLTAGQATSGAEETLQSTDCVAIIRVNGTPWSLDFEVLN